MRDEKASSVRLRRFFFHKFRRKGEFFTRGFSCAPRGMSVGLGLLAIAGGCFTFELFPELRARILGAIFIIFGALSCLQSAGFRIDPEGRRWREWIGFPLLCRRREGNLDEDVAGLKIEADGNSTHVRYLVVLHWNDASRFGWVLARRYDYARAYKDMATLGEELALPVLDPPLSPREGRTCRLAFASLPSLPADSRFQLKEESEEVLARGRVDRRLGCTIWVIVAFLALWTLGWLAAFIHDFGDSSALAITITAVPLVLGIGFVLLGIFFGTYRKEIDVGPESICLARRWRRWTWFQRRIFYDEIEEIRRFPMAVRAREILVVRAADRALEFGAGLEEPDIAWLEETLRQAAGWSEELAEC